MNKAACAIAAVEALILLLAAACSVSFPIPQNAKPAVPAPSDGPVLTRVATSQPGVQPTGLGSGVSQRVPLCEASASCQALDAEQIPLDCVKKIPYTNVLVPIGTKFEVVDQSGDFTCIDTGVVVNGKEVLTCHGRELYSFEVKLTNAACTDAALATGSGRCQDGYGYNAAQQCCAAIPAGAEGSISVRVNLGACPVPSP